MSCRACDRPSNMLSVSLISTSMSASSAGCAIAQSNLIRMDSGCSLQSNISTVSEKNFPTCHVVIFGSGKNAWVVLPSRLADFEEYAFKACDLILNGDRRVGGIMFAGERHHRENEVTASN